MDWPVGVGWLTLLGSAVRLGSVPGVHADLCDLC